MLKHPPPSPDLRRPVSEAPDGDIPCTSGCFGVPPRTLSSTLWQVLPQLAVGGAVLLASCMGGEGP